MKKLKIGVLAFLIAGIFFTACSNEPTISKNGHSFNGGSGGSVTRVEVTGKFGIFESPYEVGDIIFNDGSAIPYTAQLTLSTEQQAAAIAIIFYKGNGLNSGDDTTTNRTLGVGLKHNRNGTAWCTINANAYSKIITTVLDDDKNGSDNLEQIATFLSNPSNNTDNDTGTSAFYPAFYFAEYYSNTATNLGTIYASGWYLPSIAELDKIYACSEDTANGVDIDLASNLCGGDKFEDSWYWSSSQYASSDSLAYLLSFDIGARHYASKNGWDNYYVCAIRAFN